MLDAKLNELEKLEAGWDGRMSSAPSREAIAVARYLTAVPGGDGTIQLELHAGGCDLEIEINPAGRVISVLFSQVD